MIGKLLALLAAIALICWQSSQIHKWHEHSLELSVKLERITSAKDTQRTVTKTNIVTVTKTIHDADGRAKVVEAAPLPGQCRTPQEVRDADI
jgi:hypothetical protein